MALSPIIRATLLDDLRRQLLPVADAADPAADPAADGDAEAWIGGDELCVAIRYRRRQRCRRDSASRALSPRRCAQRG